MKEKNRKLVVVLGMHRSGTSALARSLRVLQVEMGDNLIPGQVGRNDKGYWEDADINAFNDRLLVRLGSSWHGLTHLDKAKFSALELDDLRAEARTLLEEKLAEHARFGFKDPRTAVLLPFWQPIFAQLKLDDLYLIALRNPLDVAASLLKRDAIPLTESFLLWAKYTIAALRYSKGKRRVLVQYDALLEAPEEQLKRIAECLDLPLEGQTSELQKFTREFLSKDLRHSKSSQAAINRSPEAPIFVRQAYDRLRKVAKLQIDLNSSAFSKVWAFIERDYLKAEPLYSHIDLLNASNTASRRAFQQSEMESEALRKELPKAYSLAEHASRELEQALIDRGYMGAQKDRAEQDRDRAEQDRDRAEQDRDRAEQERSDAIQELHRIQGELKGVSAERDTFLTTRDAAFVEREQAIMRMEESVAERDRADQEKARAELERSDAIQELHRIQGELKGMSAERDTFLTTRDAAIVEREQAMRSQQQLQQEAQVLQKQLAQEMTSRQQLEIELKRLFSSNSWRLTSSLRAFRRTFFTNPYWLLRRYLSNSMRAIWHGLPGDPSRKLHLKGRFFRALPTFLGWTQAYRAWVELERQQPSDSGMMTGRHEIVEMAAEERHTSVPYLEAPTLARLIAFYLPQFHPIPENDLWWGRGFTEWTNTAKARPLFPGHEIPSVPSDLGYYDLRVPESRQAQAELAKEYGIEGFCYWHYWFGNGRQLLERPFSEVLASGSPDFPFCLAWANHTWSGVWHGSPDRILIEQTYPGIKDIKMHFYSLLDAFKDDRYIKIDGRNLFCIYRPTDLQDARLFFETWRELAEKEGAPGFYFVGITDYPWDRAQDGYDAFTTNPPVGMLPYQGIKPINEEIVKGMPAGDGGSQLPQIYSYETFVENAFPEVTRREDFYPCVVPNWDNTPRSGSNGFVLHGSTPELYGRHLGEAVSLVENRDLDQRVIFVKSWNEWAETNYLEPDVKRGRAYLEKTLEIIRDEGK